MRLRTYGQFCPVALAAELFAERWVPLVLRELLGGSRHFAELRRGIPRIPPSTLSLRLRQLEDAGVLVRHNAGDGLQYQLTEAGEDLRAVIERLGLWGARWLEHEISREHLDPDFLMWSMHRHLPLSSLPTRRVVLEFDLGDPGIARRRWWMVIDAGEVDLCIRHPGHEVDIAVTTDLVTLTRIYLGNLEPHTAVRSGAVQLLGTRELTRSFARWCPRGSFADIARPPSALPSGLQRLSAPAGRKRAAR
jgi:DNA-binding HxlR family transcriptional regulator